MALAKQLDELGAQRSAGLCIDGTVDRLVADVGRDQRGIVGSFMHGPESAGNLLGRPAGVQVSHDVASARRAPLGVDLAAHTTRVASGL